MTSQQVKLKLRDEQVMQMAIQHQMDGVRKLYDAAVAMGNEEMSGMYRGQLHDLLDTQLDNSHTIMNLLKQLFSSQD